jgi:hypothetical protein
MSFSVGILYSAQEFALYVSKNPTPVEEFESTFRRFGLATPEDILEVSLKCNWIDFQPDGICRVTTRGQNILLEDAEKALRVQICDLIYIEEPSWAIKIPNGRKEAEKFFPVDVQQCFKEAGLLSGWDEDIIEWWDKLSIATRSRKSESSLVVGRTAEKLTMEHETKRIGKTPHWQSIESNFSGYDVLSKSEKGSDIQRMIEVKGSALPRKEAFCFVTRNEWDTAQVAPDYRFHLWCLKGDNPFLIDVGVEEMKLHIPTNSGNGKWETTKVPFKSFY